VLAPLFSGVLVVVLFCIWEWKGARLPIVPSQCSVLRFGGVSIQGNSVYIFKHATVSGVYITMFIKCVDRYRQNILGLQSFSSSGFIFFSALYYLPQFFQVALRYSPIHAGVFLIPLLVSQMVASWISVCVGITVSPS